MNRVGFVYHVYRPSSWSNLYLRCWKELWCLQLKFIFLFFLLQYCAIFIWYREDLLDRIFFSEKTVGKVSRESQSTVSSGRSAGFFHRSLSQTCRSTFSMWIWIIRSGSCGAHRENNYLRWIYFFCNSQLDPREMCLVMFLNMCWNKELLFAG